MRITKPKLALTALVSVLWCAPGTLQTKVVAEPPAAGLTFTNAAIDADELADFLGITIWAFAYDGGDPAMLGGGVRGGPENGDPAQDPRRQGKPANPGQRGREDSPVPQTGQRRAPGQFLRRA